MSNNAPPKNLNLPPYNDDLQYSAVTMTAPKPAEWAVNQPYRGIQNGASYHVPYPIQYGGSIVPAYHGSHQGITYPHSMPQDYSQYCSSVSMNQHHYQPNYYRPHPQIGQNQDFLPNRDYAARAVSPLYDESCSLQYDGTSAISSNNRQSQRIQDVSDQTVITPTSSPLQDSFKVLAGSIHDVDYSSNQGKKKHGRFLELWTSQC